MDGRMISRDPYHEVTESTKVTKTLSYQMISVSFVSP
jgi:hypothetical protein